MTLKTAIIPDSLIDERSLMEIQPTVNARSSMVDDRSSNDDFPQEGLRREAIEQISREREIEQKDGSMPHNDELGLFEPGGQSEERMPYGHKFRGNLRKLFDFGMSKKTSRLLIQIWQSDFSIIAFVLAGSSFYLMKWMNYPPVGVLFFLLAMAVVDAILSIFVTRLSFLQNKHGYYRSDDFERDWLRYKILMSMTKAALLFVVGTSCGTAAVVGSYVMWFFTSTQRLRYFILRWSMDDHYPELQRWSIFAILQKAGIEPHLKNFNYVAILGVVIGFAIVFLF
jgi:Na+/melibiose symporter-like transporter